VIGDGTILLRPFEPGDAPQVYVAVQESLVEVTPWMPHLNADLSVDKIAIWVSSSAEAWEHGSGYNFAVIDARGGAFLGGCGITGIHPMHRFANMYYWVRSTRMRQGVATAAVRLLARFGFETLALGRIEIVVATGNVASAALAERAGARYEGTLRNRVVLDGASRDALMFSLVPGDF
jgi:ribosomal-protein-serine acetyltransferase